MENIKILYLIQKKSIYYRKSNFLLNNRFNTISNNQQYITRELFKNNIGYLGINHFIN